MPQAARVTSEAPPGRRLQSPAGVLGGVVVALAALLVYAPGLAAGFVGDDFMILHRLRQSTGVLDVAQFFAAEFFEYYRPLGFVAHAADYGIAGADPRQFHVTNLLLHTINAILVLLIGRRLSPHSLAGPLAGLLFALHASNHEAVMWMSARFDLLATTFALAAVWRMARHDTNQVLPAFLFALAVLSKESAVALPLAAAGWLVFCGQARRGDTVWRLAPWLVALAACAVLRQIGGGVSAAGGAGRLPKLLVFGATLGLLVLLADGRWQHVRDRLRGRRTIAVALAVLLATGAVLAAASTGLPGRFAAEKFAVAGFAVFHLVSPVVEPSETPFYLDPSSERYWLGGLLLLAIASAIVVALWPHLLQDRRMWFLATLLLATLLPVSALTEGKRYLYLPSAAFSLIAAVLLAELRRPHRLLACAAVVLVLGVSVAQISAKIRDWTWAGRMTAEGAHLVDAALAPACNAGHVVFLTAPVAVRGVYTHFYYETFELPRGCRPEVFQVLVRAVRTETTATVRWEAPDRLVVTAEPYRGNFVLSSDLRHFDRPLAPGQAASIETPLGLLRAQPSGRDGVQLTLTLAEPLVQQPPLFFYYSDGAIHPVHHPDRSR